MSKIFLIKNLDLIGENQQKFIGNNNSDICKCQNENIYNIRKLLIENQLKIFDLCFYSEQLQSKLTIDILKKNFKNIEFNLETKIKNLNDINYGKIALKSKLDIIDNDFGEYLLYELLNNFNYAFENGDSYKSKYKEIYIFYEDILKKFINNNVNILVITSDLNIKFLKMLLKNYNFEEINLETFIFNKNECLPLI